jgi:DNA-directed RNA polymerase subunit RPC12/RpoP
MKNCVRCGKEIDVISKDPDKVFYCKKCSLEILNIDEEELFKKRKETKVKDNYFICYVFPGIYQLKEGRFITSFFNLYAFYILPSAWFVFFMLIYSMEGDNKLIKDGIKYYSIFVLLQMSIIFIKNAVEVKNGLDRDKSDI